MLWVPLVVGLALFLTGHALLFACRPRRHRTAAERHGTALLLGLGVVPALYANAVIWTGPIGDWTARGGLGLGAALGALALWIGRRRTADDDAPADRPGLFAKVGAGLAIALAIFAVFYGATAPLKSFDATYHFSYKGKLVHGEGIGTDGWTDLEEGVGRPHTHVRYPPSIPSLHALTANVAGRYHESFTRPVFSLFALGSAALLWGLLRPRGRGAANTAALLWLGLPFLYFSGVGHREFAKSLEGLFLGGSRVQNWHLPQGYALDGAGDMPLAALFLGAFACLWRITGIGRAERDWADAWIGGLLVGAAILCKNEGLALVAVSLVAFGLAALLRRGAPRVERPAGAPPAWAGLAIVLVLGGLIAGTWQRLSGTLPDIDENYPRAIAALPGELERFARTGQILDGYAHCFLPFLYPAESFLRWTLTWPLFLVAVLAALFRPRAFLRHPAMPAVLMVLGALALYGLILVTTPWDLDDLFRTLIPDRLVLHVTPIGIFATTLLAWRRADE